MLKSGQHVADTIRVAVGDRDGCAFATQCRGNDLAEPAGSTGYQRSAIL